MKRIFYLLALVLLANNVKAANGDTTWVQAHNGIWLNYFNNFDSSIKLPDGNKSYRKIYMIFTLGKYVCPGSPQYCSDWDYTVQNFLMTPGGDTLELGRLITPYANSARTPANWKERYVFDVTNFYPVLKDTGTIRIHYSGYSGGFTADIKFAFIEGTPERNVLGIDRLWHGSFAYGDGANPIDSKIQAINKTAPANTQAAELKFNITGHGNDNGGCSEFCKKYYQVKVNGTQVAQKDIWRDDCGSNNLYPQSGTWIYERGNWCPGDRVEINTHALTGVTAGNAYDVDVDFENHSSTGGASYTLEGQVFYYGAMNKAVDASLDDIIAPTDFEGHFRSNDLCGTPKIKVKNTGSSAITSIKFEYGVDGTTLSEYTWQGSLASLEEAEIILPEPYELRELSLKGITITNKFVARIKTVNGQADEDAFNNELTSYFKAAPVWPSRFVINLNTNKSEANGKSETSWKIYFLDGTVAAERSNTSISTQYRDTINLGPGCYRMVVDDQGCDGVAWSFYQFYPQNPGFGSMNAKKTTGTVITSDLPLKGYYGGDFGCGFTQYFTIGWPSVIENVDANNRAGIDVYPNPASQALTISLIGAKNVNGTIQIVDALGRVVMEKENHTATQQVNVASLANGMYTVVFTDDSNAKLQTRVMIAR